MTSKPYSNIPYLIQLYDWMRDFEKQTRIKPAIEEMVNAGFSPSTSVVRYYLDRMEELGMIERPFLERNGKRIRPNRSVILLPLDRAHETVRRLVAQK